MQQCGHGDVVRQVGHQGGGLIGEVSTPDTEDVAVEHRQPVDLAVRVLGDRFREPFSQHRVDFDGGDVRAAIKQGQGQRSQSRADLQNVVGLGDTRGGHDAPQRISIVDEVLSQRLARSEVEFLG